MNCITSGREKGRRIAREYEDSANGKCISDAYRDRRDGKTIASGILEDAECNCRRRAVGNDLVDGLLSGWFTRTCEEGSRQDLRLSRA